MKLASNLLLLVTVLSLGFSRTSFGQDQPQTITCSSSNNRRNTCDFPSRNVTLSRQISGARCIQGQSWGWDNHAIWVDRGCGAEFTIGDNWRGRPGTWQGGPRKTITCVSTEHRHNWCDMPRHDVTVGRQISGAPCVQGQTWGWDNRSIWVDRGCRAEFLVR
jgi:Protein of unknown function (DUF3011)